MTTRRAVISGIAAAAGSLIANKSFAIQVDPGAASVATPRLLCRLEKASGYGIAVSDVPSGRALTLADPAPLFELVLANADGSETVLDAAKATEIHVTQSDGGLRLAFLRLNGQPIDVTCDIGEGEGGALAFRASIGNGGALPVRALRYPILTLNPSPGSEDTHLLMPMMETFGLVRNPHHYLPSPALAFKWLRDTGYFGRSPGNLSAQFAAYYDSAAGLYTAAYDAKGWRKELAMDAIGGKVRLTWINYFPEILAHDQKIDYDLVLSTFKGDWYDAADIYKAWARAQPWCAKKLTERDAVPEWISRGSLWLSLENATKAPDGTLLYYGDNLEKLMERWTALLPQPPVLHYRWTDKFAEAATFLDWSPFFPSDEIYQSTLPAQKKHGVRAWLMINGYNLTLTEGSDGKGGYLHDERDRFQKEAATYAVRGPKGEIATWGVSWIPNSTRVEMCRGTDWAQTFNDKIAERYAEVGFSLCQMDQTIGGGGEICYAKDHGHPPGGGTWFTDTFRKQLKSIMALGRRRDPEFSTSEEAPNELFIQELGTFQSRDHIELPMLVYPAAGEMEKPWDVKVVPVFAYLYHPYIIGYTSWVGMSSGVAPVPQSEEMWETVGVTALAKSLIYGKLPGVFEGSCNPDKASGTKRFRILMQHAALTGGDEKRYLLWGEMLRPPPLETDTVDFTFQYRYPLLRDYPRVMHGAYEAADGKRAVFLVNVSDDNAKCTLSLTDIAGPRKQAALCRFDNGKIVKTPAAFADQIALSLAPLEAMYVEMG